MANIHKTKKLSRPIKFNDDKKLSNADSFLDDFLVGDEVGFVFDGDEDMAVGLLVGFVVGFEVGFVVGGEVWANKTDIYQKS